LKGKFALWAKNEQKRDIFFKGCTHPKRDLQQQKEKEYELSVILQFTKKIQKLEGGGTQHWSFFFVIFFYIDSF